MPDQILVLVAEDEELVGFVIVDVLEDAGFEVIEVEHPDAALDILHIHATRIQVLFTIFRCLAPSTALPLRITRRKTGPRLPF
jgi:CheY-like chemotaxis protein